MIIKNHSKAVGGQKANVLFFTALLLVRWKRAQRFLLFCFITDVGLPRHEGTF